MINSLAWMILQMKFEIISYLINQPCWLNVIILQHASNFISSVNRPNRKITLTDCILPLFIRSEFIIKPRLNCSNIQCYLRLISIYLLDSIFFLEANFSAPLRLSILFGWIFSFVCLLSASQMILVFECFIEFSGQRCIVVYWAVCLFWFCIVSLPCADFFFLLSLHSPRKMCLCFENIDNWILFRRNRISNWITALKCILLLWISFRRYKASDVNMANKSQPQLR